MKKALFLVATSLFLFNGCQSSINSLKSSMSELGDTLSGTGFRQNQNKEAYYFKDVEGTSVNRFAVNANHPFNRKMELLENKNGIHFIDYGVRNRDKKGMYSPVDVYNFSTMKDKYYRESYRSFHSLYKTFNRLKYKKYDDLTYLGFSKRHKTLLHISSEPYMTKELRLNNDKEFRARGGRSYKFTIEYIDYKNTIAKINKALKEKNYTSIYNIKDRYIKYFIKKDLLRNLANIKDETKLEEFAPILTNTDIKSANNLILAQQNNINIIKEFEQIKTKKDKKAFLSKKNTIFKVIKKAGIKDEPNYKTSETLGYVEREEIIIAQELKKNWILTEQGWINKGKLEPLNKTLNRYKSMAKSLKL